MANLTPEKPPFRGNGSGIYLVREKSPPGKPIWLETNEYANWPARVDSLGEWVGWTQMENPYEGGTWVAIKRLSDPSWVAPTQLRTQYTWCNFCDWTEDGNILVAIYDAKYRGLAVMTKTGREVRRIPVPIAPMAMPASYRKNWRQ